MKPAIRKAAGAAVIAAAALFVGSLYLPFPKSKLSPSPVVSLRITDRNGLLLREVLSEEGGRCRWLGLREVSPKLVLATLAAEDRNFFLHKGVNLLSTARALFQNLKRGRTVSGASTITQQVVRNIDHRLRNLPAKLAEVWLAVRLEHTASKEEILTQYLNRVSYGNQAFGIEAASRLYFDKPAAQLSLAESAFLAGLPRSPSVTNPYRNLGSARKRQRGILARMAELGWISKEELARALEENLRFYPADEKFRAPHFCDYLLRTIPPEKREGWSEVRTTLDSALQEKVEILLSDHLRALEKRGISNGAAVVMDNRTGEILAMVGSKDFFDEAHDGQVNGASSLRQPGSALKPFTYALALEKGMTAASLIEDGPEGFPTTSGYYMPENYDRKFHGLVRLRSALACSYNVPAVSVLDAVGYDFLHRRLKSLGFESLAQPASHYGMGLTLGNGEVTLLELVNAYAAFARQGVYRPQRFILSVLKGDVRHNSLNSRRTDSPLGAEQTKSDAFRAASLKFSAVGPKESPERVFSPEVSFLITHILADPDARVPSFGYLSPLSLPFPCASKTGTSKDYRDNWTVGYTPRFTVGVWVGNFDGRPMHNVSGITGCGPLFKDIMLLLEGKNPESGFDQPKSLTRRLICPISGKLASRQCPGRISELFMPGTEPSEFCQLIHAGNIEERGGPFFKAEAAGRNQPEGKEPAEFRIVFPRPGDIFKVDPILRKEYQTIKLRARFQGTEEVQDVEWWVNGDKIALSGFPFACSWRITPGTFNIRAVAMAQGRRIEARPVRITVVD